MQRNLNHDEFDQFLKETADDLRMRPSGRVWKGIAKELDRRKRRFGTLFAATLLLLSSAYITWEITATQALLQIARHTAQPVYTSVAQPTPATSKTTTQNIAAVKLEQTKVNSKQTIAVSNKIWKAEKRNNPTSGMIAAILPVAEKGQATANEPVETIANNVASPAALLHAEKTAMQPAIVPQQRLTQTMMMQDADARMSIKPRSRKLSWQVFATPTVSYRKLSDNKNYVRPILTTGVPANFSALYGINEAVIHKPDLGIEFGVMTRYPITKNLSLRTGFQFNVSRYDIKAFSYVPEVATFALNNGFWVDSVRAISNYRTLAGSGSSNWLQNFYFQASMPVGLELKVAGNKKAHWGIASSLQPTYVIGNRSYMITADYKNYARVPWLTRKWNVNTSLETFVSLNSGKTQWQIGPQVRYQALSSFINEYPVKENLFDFGMKVGVTLK